MSAIVSAIAPPCACAPPAPPGCRASRPWVCRLSVRRCSSRAPLWAAAAAAGEASRGGAVLILPGFLFSSRQYASLATDLSAKGFHADVVPMGLQDWLPVLKGSSFEFYLERSATALRDLHARHGHVALLGHSAGGWIARILLGGEPYQGACYGCSDLVHTLLTLGTPHASVEAYPFGRFEEALTGSHVERAPAGVRGSSLQFANYFYPSAGSLGGVRVVCACGDAIRGRNPWAGKGGGGGGAGHSAWDEYLAFEGYKSGCGRGDVDGDGVTPLCIACVPGAEELVLPGVWHSPRRSAGQLWYGDPAVQEQWQQYLLDPQASGAALGSG